MNTQSFPSDIAFTPAVKDVQRRQLSRAQYERMEKGRGWATKLTPKLKEFVGEQISFFMATINTVGQPYIQHRGGPPGFLHVLDDSTLAFADFSGNQQYITLGNLSENSKVHLFLIDYAHRRRVKIWGTAKVVEDDPELLSTLTLPEYRARPERVIVIKIETWDENCPQHIPQRFEAADVELALKRRDERIAALEMEIDRLKSLVAK